MPKVPHDFSNEMIFYIIKSNDLEKTDIYVGSTFNFLKRKWQHKSDCTNVNSKGHNLKIYVYIRENGGWDAFTMTMLDRKVCVDMLEARQHEQSLIDKYKATLNMYKAFGAETREEYIKQYYTEHKEELKQYSKEQGKQYRLEHIDKAAERSKQHYIKNADKLKEKYTCECGSICNRQHISRHIKSKKHQDYLATKESVEIS